MDPLAKVRKLQEEKYQQHQAAQASQKAAQEGAKAAEDKKKRQDAVRKKIADLEQKRSHYTHFDWAATRLQNFARNRLQSRSRASELVVTVFGVSYPFSIATHLYDVGEEPFDSQEAKSAYNAVLIKMQNHEQYVSRDNQLSPQAVVLFLLACFSKGKRPDPELLFGLLDDQIVMELISLNLHDHPKLSLAIRLMNLLQSQSIPPQLFKNFPHGINLEEVAASIVQEIQLGLEIIGESQARLEDAYRQPNPNDEVKCTICQQSDLVRNMHSHPQGSLLFCTDCAPIVGIFPQGFFPDDDRNF
jgi:hypothetical protein